MTRPFALPALVVSVVLFPVLIPLRLAWHWLRRREELRSIQWTRGNLEKAVHEITLMVGPPVTAAASWALYEASGWGPGGTGGQVRGAVLGWVGAGLVVLAVAGARHGEVADEVKAQTVPEHPARFLLGSAGIFGGLLLTALALVLFPLAFILSI
jgi:hypothetical protein